MDYSVRIKSGCPTLDNNGGIAVDYRGGILEIIISSKLYHNLEVDYLDNISKDLGISSNELYMMIKRGIIDE